MLSHLGASRGRSCGSARAIGNEFALVFAADENYVLGLAVAMHSALVQLASTAQPEVYVLANDLSESSRARLVKVVKDARALTDIHWIAVRTEQLGRFKAGGHLSSAAYSRLLIPDLIPPHVRRAVYLDADLLVRGDLSPLFTIDLGGALIATVRDFGITSTAHEWSGVRERTRPRPYFNTGVLVMDVTGWRREGLAQQALRYASSGPAPLPWADQDALNAIVQSWYELDLGWNVQLSGRSLFAATPPPSNETETRLLRERGVLSRAEILHFPGPCKPWHPWCTTPGTMMWERSMLHTGWYQRKEAVRWLLARRLARLRYRFGNKRRQWWQRVRQVFA